MVLEEESITAGMAAGSQSRKLGGPISATHRKQRMHWRWGEAINSQGSPPVMDFLQQGSTSLRFLTSQIRPTTGDQIQIPEPMGDIAHSNHYRDAVSTSIAMCSEALKGLV